MEITTPLFNYQWLFDEPVNIIKILFIKNIALNSKPSHVTQKFINGRIPEIRDSIVLVVSLIIYSAIYIHQTDTQT